jgi:hypothetical protein
MAGASNSDSSDALRQSKNDALRPPCSRLCQTPSIGQGFYPTNRRLLFKLDSALDLFPRVAERLLLSVPLANSRIDEPPSCCKNLTRKIMPEVAGIIVGLKILGATDRTRTKMNRGTPGSRASFFLRRTEWKLQGGQVASSALS